MAKIYVASAELSMDQGTNIGEHSYYVYDPDGNPNSGDEKIIRGGNTGVEGDSRYVMEINRDIANSRDALDGDDPYDDRNYTTVYESGGGISAQDVEDKWDEMIDIAESLGNIDDDPDDTNFNGEDVYALPDTDYAVFLENCHALTGTISKGADLSVTPETIKSGGDTGLGNPVEHAELQFWGMDGEFVSKGNDTVTMGADSTKYYDQGGADVYQYDYGTEGDPNETIILFEDSNTGTADRIEISGVDPEDITFKRFGKDGLLIYIDPPGSGGSSNTPAFYIPNQFDGDLKINAVWVYPTGGGGPSVAPLNDPDDFPTELPGEIPGWVEDPRGDFDDAPEQYSPLVLDLDSDGIELTTFNAATTETFFDLDGDGFAEQTAWVSSDDGLLVRDVDASGTIDSGSELFGSADVDGFAILSELDSNGDLIIDANDEDWSDLKIWQDANSDAVSQNTEIVTLASLNIASISLLEVAASSSTISGNAISHTSTFKYNNGSTGSIVDAWFVHDDVNSVYANDYESRAVVQYLPNLRGFGKLASLDIAMSGNDDLLESVYAFAVEWDFDVFADAATLNGDIEEILYQWAGVDGVSSSSRGPNVDAQHLEFLEKFFAKDFLQWGTESDPWTEASVLIERSWDSILQNLKAHLLTQTGAAALYDGTATYDLVAGEISGTMSLDQTAINALVSFATDTGVDTHSYWVQVAEYIANTKGITNVTGTEEGWLDTAISNSGLGDDWDDIVDYYQSIGQAVSGTTTYGSSSDETLNGTGANDQLYGQGGADIINGGNGDDIVQSSSAWGSESVSDELYGGDGNDTLHGDGGDDILSGGAGGDFVFGHYGDDTYVYTSGDDVYHDQYLTDDKILMPAGIDSSDLSFQIKDGDDLLIIVDGLGTIEIENQLQSGGWEAIEIIEFDDTSTLNLLNIDTPIQYGTDVADTIYGVVAGTGDYDDEIFGLGGNDTINAYGGVNIVDGGAGNDQISVSGTENTIIASPGFDTLYAPQGGTTLVVPEEYSSDDLTLYRTSENPDHLYIQIVGLGQIESQNQMNYGYGFETITFADASPAITLANVGVVTHGTPSDDTITGYTNGAHQDQTIYGYEGNDTLTGQSGNDSLYGHAGNDTLNGNHGDDVLYAGTGDDDLYGGQGSDLYVVTSGMNYIKDANNSSADVLHLTGGITINDISVSTSGTWDANLVINTSVDEVFLQWHRDPTYAIEIIKFDDGFETDLTAYSSWLGIGSGNDIVAGGGSDETIIGYAGNDDLSGNGGADDIHGGTGADTLNGGSGNDLLHGGAGDDTLYGEDGLDTLFGGDGADTFVFESGLISEIDVISDFDAGDSDVIDLADVLSYDSGSDVLTDFVQFTDNGNDTSVSIDADGTGGFTQIATILNVTGLTDEAALVSSGNLIVE